MWILKKFCTILWVFKREVVFCTILRVIKVVQMLTIKLFGHDVPVKTTDCTGAKIEPYVNFFVRMTDHCTSNCPFCPYHSEKSKPFDIVKFKYAFDGIIEAGIWINKIGITGGEPTMCMDKVQEIVSHVHKVDPQVPITINTNGQCLKELDKKRFLNKVNDIALSVHHYDEDRNNAIFQSKKHATIKDIRCFVNKEKLHLRCNLIRDQIDSPEEVRKFLEFFSEMGIQDFGFVSMMLVNSYCKNMFISYREAGVDKQPNTRLTRKLAWKQCTCKNYMSYTKKGRLYRYYTRTDKNDADNKVANKLVFDKDELRIGFNGEIIV
jgi:molybdenum cofactor biosynthesis enzyme MoaA